MAEEKIPYAKMAIAVAVGIMVGALISSGDSDEVRKLNRRIAALESAASEQVTALAERVQELGTVESALAAAQSAIDELGAKVGEMVEAPAAPEADPEADAAMAALNDRVTVLADQMGRLATSLLAGTMPAPAPAEADDAEEVTEAEDAAPAEEAAEAAEEATEEAVAAEDEAVEDEAVAEEAAPAEEPMDAAETGEIGLLLAVGDTGMIGDRRVFVSRIDVPREAVRLMIVGDGPRMLGRGFGPLDLGNGCTVELKGIVDRMALILASCAE